MFVIRQETEKDYQNTYTLVKEAFSFATGMTKGDEENRVSELKKSSTFIPELSLVAEEDNQLVAYNILTRFNNCSIKGKDLKALLLGPICVKLEYRNKGIGKSIIIKGLEIAKHLGYEVVFLFGEPEYYNKIGFKQVSDYNIDCLNKNIPTEKAMLIELIPNVLKDVKGTIVFVF